jgi:hypothetical protein
MIVFAVTNLEKAGKNSLPALRFSGFETVRTILNTQTVHFRYHLL